MILLIDLILHKLQAYRHLLYNVINRETVNLEGLLWNSTIGFILLDASGVSRFKDFLLAIFISGSFKIFLVAMMELGRYYTYVAIYFYLEYFRNKFHKC